MKFLTRKGFLIGEQGITYLGDTDPDTALGPLRAAACTYRIALGPRAGQKVLSLQTLPTEPPLTPVGCVNAQGFSLHGAPHSGDGDLVRAGEQCSSRGVPNTARIHTKKALR